jgi:hypothetical protein
MHTYTRLHTHLDKEEGVGNVQGLQGLLKVVALNLKAL